MKIFNLRNDTNETISFIPYRETFQVNVKPNDLKITDVSLIRK